MSVYVVRLVLALLLCGALLACAFGCAAPQGRGANAGGQTMEPKSRPKPREGGEGRPRVDETGEFEVLAQGAYGALDEPFLAVARDASIYGELRRLSPGLPELSADYFKSRAVVAAFLGTRPTGGYAVRMTREPDGRIIVAEQSPPAGAIVTEALTQPFKVVSVARGDEEGVEVRLEGKWTEALARRYRVASGRFESSGGFAGRKESFEVAGSLGVARHAGLVTLLFDLRGTGAGRERVLGAAVTGKVDGHGHIEVASADAGTLIERPRSPVRIAGQLTKDDAQLSLTFTSLPARVADGYSGGGQLDAVADAPPPKSRRLKSGA